MAIRTDLVFKCRRCGGRKYIGDEYYAMGAMYVDVTCLQCAHSIDISVEKIKEFIAKVEKIVDDN